MMIILKGSAGQFIFKEKSMLPNKITRTRSQKISEHALIGQRNRLQHLGVGKDEFNLTGSIFPNCNTTYTTATSVDELSDLADKGEALLMMKLGRNGYGILKGRWFVSDISENNAFYDKNFNAQRIDFSCILKRQG